MNSILKKINKSNFIFLIVSIICILLYFYDLAYKTVDIPAKKIKIMYLIIAFVVAALLYCLLKILDKIQKKELHIIFAIMAIFLGLIYFALAPFYVGSDEEQHFYRIYEISEGTLITPSNGGYVGSKLPSSLKQAKTKEPQNIKYSDIKNMTDVRLDKNNKEAYKDIYPNTALYSPIQYIPQLIGVSIGKILTLSPYFLGMLGRFFNFVFYVIIATIAIKILPRHKIFAMTILLAPAMFNIATTLSADAITNVTAILFMAYILKIIYSDDVISKKDYAILGILTILISIFKIVYLLFVGLLLLIPKEKFKNTKQKYGCIALMFLAGTVISAAWLSITSNYFANYYTNGGAQKAYMLSRPLRYCFIVFRSMCYQCRYLAENIFAGQEMYTSQLAMYEIIPIIFIIINIISATKEEKENRITTYQKMYIGLIAICIIGLICTALYIQCTAQFVKIGNDMVAGMQGRYFIPILLLGVLLIDSFNNKKVENITLLKMIVITTFPVYLTMVVRFIA